MYLILSKNNVFVWNADDWLKLRQDHRVLGDLIGSFPKSTRQDVFLGLPLLLLPEEVTLLLEKNIACLVQNHSLGKPPTVSLSEKFEEYRNTLFIEQAECLRKNRSKQITSLMDKIVEGKKRKMLGLHTNKKKMRKTLDKKTQEALDSIEINTQNLLEEELAKLPKLTKNEAFVQTHTAYPWFNRDDIEIVQWKYPFTSDQQVKYKVYKDLWERGYYITNGDKFGGDFLIYPGDPIMFHSQFIIQCQCKDEEISVIELVAKCRISCHVRKTLVLAMYCKEEDRVKYQSLQWAGSKTLENS
ncbi:PREDICTED: tRNA-splicing endonuclease subunit Sen34 [Dinoponera quadriceps]|uniref:tRNA-splicing endonuclease subunit Sen34 n=1 Tax=Dinoponera quadriceps TaxID=609295 RepID=A0A6P3WT89_DINQU|nr:PREDICTED: tRNA-splicing endonuclease subunit Sen34 [Dinoponera quadriceps]